MKSTVGSQMYKTEALRWEAFLSGNHQAFEDLFRDKYSALYHYALRFHHQEDIAHECVQQLFCKLWESRTRLSRVENVKAYLFKALRTYLQRESVYQQRITHLEYSRAPITFSPEDIIVKDETDAYRKKIIANTLNVLPQRQREVVYLKYYEDLSYAQIAVVLQINYQSVVNLVFRAIKSLRQEDQLKKIAAFSIGTSAITFFSYLIY